VWFAEECSKASAEFESKIVNNWAVEAETNWQAGRELLARRFPQRWGNVERRELSVPGMGQMSLELIWGDEPQVDALADGSTEQDAGPLDLEGGDEFSDDPSTDRPYAADDDVADAEGIDFE
jgi:hypothetical protein